MGEEPPTDVDERIGPMMRRGAGGLCLHVVAGRVAQGHGQHLGRLGVEVALEVGPALHEPRQVQAGGGLGALEGIEAGLGPRRQ
jgi:hypothetical protein